MAKQADAKQLRELLKELKGTEDSALLKLLEALTDEVEGLRKENKKLRKELKELSEAVEDMDDFTDELEARVSFFEDMMSDLGEALDGMDLEGGDWDAEDDDKDEDGDIPVEFTFECPHCGKEANLSLTNEDDDIICPHCHQPLFEEEEEEDEEDQPF
ncbi:MAG: hypothetical protein IKP40_00235 [Clostridia bacterium]|nr:hypothetical protein [Clostridia bacterium]